MGVMKRIQGWRNSGWPIPKTLQVLVGLIEPRDPEAFLERKRVAKEAARERVAIQEERSLAPVGDARKRALARLMDDDIDDEVEIPPRSDHTRSIDRILTPEQYAEIDAVMAPLLPSVEELIEAICPDRDFPIRVQPGWYRVGSTFYRNGEGPFADWSRSEPSPIPGCRQLLLF